MRPDVWDYVMRTPSLRKQVDPQFRKEESRKDENNRVSQHFSRMTSGLRSLLKENEKVENSYMELAKMTRGVSREENFFVEMQVKFLITAINEMKKVDKGKALHFKDQALRTMNVEHQELKRKLISNC